MRWEHWFWLMLLLAAGFLAWQRHCLIDDAFISFTYARHFAEGHGLVWAPNSTEFGYTNFLFTLLIGCLHVFGIEPLAAAFLISVPCYLAALPVLHALMRRLSPVPLVASIATVTLAVHYTVSAYATSGLETSMQMLLILAAYHAAVARRPHDLAVIASLALLCRLDSALLLAPAFLYALWVLPRAMRVWAALLLPPALTLGVFLAGCWWFYGYPLPNTFYAKMLLPRSYLPEGWAFLKTFVMANAGLPVLLPMVALYVGWRARLKPTCWMPIAALLSACVLWSGYILKIGGDFMEFRLMVPILPLLYAACFALLGAWRHRFRSWMLYGVGALHLLVGLSVAPQFRATNLVGSLPVMYDQLYNPEHNWQMVGQALGEYFYTGSAEDVKMAVLVAGALPYYSRLASLDMYGLNDRWVAQHGEVGSAIAGHRKKAPFLYLQQQRVHVVLPELPVYECPNAKPPRIRPYHDLPVLLIPLASGCRVVAYYLTRHPRVEQLIQTHDIEYRE